MLLPSRASSVPSTCLPWKVGVWRRGGGEEAGAQSGSHLPAPSLKGRHRARPLGSSPQTRGVERGEKSPSKQKSEIRENLSCPRGLIAGKYPRRHLGLSPQGQGGTCRWEGVPDHSRATSPLPAF